MRPSGPIPATIAIVGEAPGAEEERYGEPFLGPSGKLLNAALESAGILRSSCFVTNVCRHRPPENDITNWLSKNKKAPHPDWRYIKGLWCDPRVAAGFPELARELKAAQPKLIIALGGTALWALTDKLGILKWRGSRLWSEEYQCHVIPSVHPAAVLRQLELQVPFTLDLRRARAVLEGTQQPREYSFAIRPTYLQALYRLGWLHEQASRRPLVLSCDIETRVGYMACLGLAWTHSDALCIPFLQAKGSAPFYWSLEEEAQLRYHVAQLFHHPNITWVGQNFLYDCQYFVREGMGFPSRVFDTMIGHHSLFSNLRKGLDFLSSFYAQDHIYWKDESKNWDPSLGEDQLWIYNCKDACITLECYDGIHKQFEGEAAK